jgi:hypothetical protein
MNKQTIKGLILLAVLIGVIALYFFNIIEFAVAVIFILLIRFLCY